MTFIHPIENPYYRGCLQFYNYTLWFTKIAINFVMFMVELSQQFFYSTLNRTRQLMV